MDKAYKRLEPTELWRHFAMLNHIPRCSGRESAARAYVQQVAEAAGTTWKVDDYGNIVVYVPAQKARAASPAVVVQTHLDMVCEKLPTVTHDFTKDPIRPRREGDWIFASGTTLGADNGIGVAASLALLTRPGLRHGPLELLFTVEEETGLQGALALDPDLLHARVLVNLDSEALDKLTIGSAGAVEVLLHFPLVTEPAPGGWIGREVVLSGLKGGHSGLQIHERHANAVKLLTDVLLKVRAAGVNFRLASMEGGSTHNAIPRNASTRISIAPNTASELNTAMTQVADAFRVEWEGDEPDLALHLREIPAPHSIIADPSRDLLLRLLDELPHGVLAMSEAFPGTVKTSSNLAYARTQNQGVEILTSSRSFSDTELRKVQSRIEALGELLGAKVEVRAGYPGWPPNQHSSLLKLTRRIYQQVYGKPPELRVTHGGLECGVIESKLPGMDAISFGPLIKCAHTPEEHVYASSVGTTWCLLVALLQAL